MRLKSLLLFTLPLVLLSCEGEQLKQRDYTKPAGNRIALNLKATLPDGSSLLWDQSAKIGIFGSDTTVNVPCSISASSAGTEEGLFYTSINWTDAGEEIYVYYPYNVNDTTKVLSGRLPQTYSQQSASALNKSNLFYAKVSGGNADKGGFQEVDLSPVLTMSSLKLSTETYIGWSVEKVAIKAKAGEVLSGSYTYDLASDTFATLGDGTDSIAVVLSDEILGSNGLSVFWLAKAGTGAINADIDVFLSKEGEKNKLLKGSASTSATAPVDMDTFVASDAKDEAIDLSCPDGGAVETANCYVVPKAGVEYKFPVTVMGNGASGGSVLAPKSAKVLWQTGAGMIQNIKLKEGYVFFTVDGNPDTEVTPGNAVIAIYNDEGRILWSWHLWITGEDLASKLQTWKTHPDTPAAYKDPQLMDRNLGALSNVDFATSSTNSSKGLNYQWGRKDPFIGPDNSSMTSRIAAPTYDADGNLLPAMAAASSFSNNPRWTHVDTKLTPADIAAYPMAFVSGASNYIWLDGDTDNLWADQKTIYDPCPPGYKVMNKYAMSGVTNAIAGGKIAQLTSHHIINIDSFRTNGADLQVYCDGVSEIAYLPSSGLVYFEKAENFFPFDRVGTYGYIWSCSIGSPGATKASRMHYDYATFTSMENSYGSYGHNVRCEKIK